MKMMIIVCPESREKEINDLIARHEVHAFSQIRDVIGAGKTGKKMGTQVWPGESVLTFAVMEDSKSEELKDALRTCAQELYPGEGMRAFVLTIEDVI
jgi:hypothetical protein